MWLNTGYFCMLTRPSLMVPEGVKQGNDFLQCILSAKVITTLNCGYFHIKDIHKSRDETIQEIVK